MPPNFLGTAPPATAAKLPYNGLLPPPMFSLLFVCLTVTLHKYFQTDLHETFSEGWQWANEQVFKFWWQSGPQSDSSLLGDMESG